MAERILLGAIPACWAHHYLFLAVLGLMPHVSVQLVRPGIHQNANELIHAFVQNHASQKIKKKKRPETESSSKRPKSGWRTNDKTYSIYPKPRTASAETINACTPLVQDICVEK